METLKFKLICINALRVILVFSGLHTLFATETRADEVKLKLVPTGAAHEMGVYYPQRLELARTKPAGLKKMPTDVVSPLFGELKLGPGESPTTFLVLVDESEGRPPRLFVDANGNGDLTDEPPAQWKPEPHEIKGKKFNTLMGGANLKVPYDSETLELHVVMYRFDKNEPGFEQNGHATSLIYYSDYARAGDVTLGPKTYKALLVDELATGDFRRASKDSYPPGARLILDLNDDGKFDEHHESFSINKPFNIGGTTYEIREMTPSGSLFQIVKSTRTVAETKPLPSLTPGHKALSFEAKTIDGNVVRFPESFKGKVVLLDFWATWCVPCMNNMPSTVEAYGKFHEQGFEVLGVSLDQPEATGKLASFLKAHKMSWPEIYDGKSWKSEVVKLYGCDSIPQLLLVDGDTGLILSGRGDLHGGKLSQAIEKALAKKKAK